MPMAATDRFRLFPVLPLRRLFVGLALLHLAKHAFALHFLFQDAERLAQVVVATSTCNVVSFRIEFWSSAAEVLMMTGSVRESIKRPIGNPPLKELMESGGSMYGMQTFEMHIKELIRSGIVERDVGRAAMGF